MLGQCFGKRRFVFGTKRGDEVRREEKSTMVQGLKKNLEGTRGLVLVRPQGLKVSELEMVRRRLRQAGARLRVVKNTLFRLALQDTPYRELGAHLKGPVAALSVYEQIGPTLSALMQARAAVPTLEVLAGYLGGRLRAPQEIEGLANLPGLETVAAQLVVCLQGPMIRLVRVLQAPIVQLAGTLQAAAQKRSA